MMKSLISFLSFCAIMAVGTLAQAGVSGSAVLDIKDFKLQLLSGVPGAPRTATGILDFAGADLTFGSISTTAVNKSNLTGYLNSAKGGGFGATRAPFSIGAIQQPLDAVSGLLAGDYTRSQSSFSGSLVDFAPDPFLNAIPVGAKALTSADFNVGTAGLIGGANSSVTNNTSLEFSVSNNVTAQLQWQGLVSLLLSDSGTPPNFVTTASTSFSIAITETSSNKAIALGTVTDDLNRSITLPPGPTSSTNGGYVSYATNVFDLKAGATYTLSINQSSTIKVAQVPEPASLAVFGLLSVGALVVRRRNRKS